MTPEQEKFIQETHKQVCYDWQIKIQEMFPNVIEENKKTRYKVYYSYSWA